MSQAETTPREESDRTPRTEPNPAAAPEHNRTENGWTGNGTTPDVTVNGGFAADIVEQVQFNQLFAFVESAGSRMHRTALPAGAVPQWVRDRARHAFVEPAGYRRARGALGGAPLLILRGARGTGREAAALHLLDELRPGATLVALRPSMTWPELGSYPYRDGLCYVLSDHQDPLDPSERQFLPTAMDRALAGKNCLLIVTTRSDVRPPAGISVVDIEAPPAPDVVAAEVAAHGRRLTPQQMTLLCETAVEDPGPAAVSALVESALEASAGIEDYLATVRDAGTAICAELDAVEDNADLAVIVTLAFFPDAPVSEFDRMVDALRRTLDGDLEPPGERQLVRPSRARITDSRLVRVVEADIDRFGTRDRIVTTRADSYARLCLRELNSRYGENLWAPLHGWLESLILDSAAASTEFVAERAAWALATLAEWAPARVLGHYIEPWSGSPLRDGSLDPRFLVATFALSLMDPAGGANHKRAATWCRDRELGRHLAGAFALVGPLGVSDLWGSFEALWDFGTRTRNTGLSHRFIAQLVAVAVEAGVSPHRVFEYINRRYEQARTKRPAACRRPLQLLFTVMNPGPRPSAEPLPCVRMLAEDPDAADALVAALQPALSQIGFLRPATEALCALLTNAAQTGSDAVLRSLADSFEHSGILDDGVRADVVREIAMVSMSDRQARLSEAAIAAFLQYLDAHHPRKEQVTS